MLYTQLDGLSKVNEILYVKVESDDVQRVVDDFAGYSGRLGKRLTTLSKQFPALDIHRDHTPAILKAAYEAQKKGLLKMFAPVVGASGKVFERGLLIRLLVAADEERYLTEELGEREPDPVLSEIMQHASQRFVGLSNEINALLKKRFYK
ncbi:MAG: hypothetical protein PF501_03845 [Salinisphaera sp.]|nr:hypothetical protein [Salinisphaera sp.]